MDVWWTALRAGEQPATPESRNGNGQRGQRSGGFSILRRKNVRSALSTNLRDHRALQSTSKAGICVSVCNVVGSEILRMKPPLKGMTDCRSEHLRNNALHHRGWGFSILTPFCPLPPDPPSPGRPRAYGDLGLIIRTLDRLAARRSRIEHRATNFSTLALHTGN